MGAEQSAAAQAAYPNRPLEAGKAWREMIHRYAAGTLVLIIIVIAALAIATRRSAHRATGYALALFGIVVLQAILGMLTVTWLLKPLIVTLHLLFGMTTLGLMWWLFLSLPRRRLRAAAARRRRAAPRQRARRWPSSRSCVLGVQIALGGWTSSNYAAVACPDFPKCQNAWWPHADFRNAFVLWRGLAINFEGGVLDNPARVAIHLTHRLGALADRAGAHHGRRRHAPAHERSQRRERLPWPSWPRWRCNFDRHRHGAEGFPALAGHGSQRGRRAAVTGNARACMDVEPFGKIRTAR